MDTDYRLIREDDAAAIIEFMTVIGGDTDNLPFSASDFASVDPEDEFSVLETTLEEGQWFAFRPPMPVAKISNIRYGQQETVKSNTKIVEFKGLGNGFSNTLYFRRIHGKWKLVKFEDLGD